MVRMPGFLKNYGTMQSVFQRCADYLVVYAPSQIFCSCIGPVTPPGIFMRLSVKVPEHINKPNIKKLRHPIPFIGQKARGVGIGFWIMYVNTLMTNIKITTYDKVGNRQAELLYIVK